MDVNAIEFEQQQMCAVVKAYPLVQAREEDYKSAEQKFGRCSICKQAHTYIKNVGGEDMSWPSCRLSSCELFEKMTPAEKGAAVEKHGACHRCLSWLHGKAERCTIRPPYFSKNSDSSRRSLIGEYSV